MAKIIGGIGLSHTPSMGWAYDKAMAAHGRFSPEWQPWYDGTRAAKAWIEQIAPDQIVVIYNDHFNQFDFDAYPSFAIGVAEKFDQADESYGLRNFPALRGDPDFGWAMTRSLIEDEEFDLTVCQQLEIDHGIYSWFPYLFDAPWPVPILPIAVNMLRVPMPTPKRIWKLGEAIRRTIAALPGDARVLIVATGGMSHQIVGERFGMANEGLDLFFLDRLQTRARELLAIPQREYMRLGGTEAAELAIWYGMRAALSDDIVEVHRAYTFPKITGCGIIAFEEADGRD